ncbi:V-type ATPase [Ascobolus immersus RN42]|uniref:V-type proton ATPase subunit G n=1 Tax=Ascobolus immersus RN42 TaxID=1160509 RepID=A0A3N4IEP8_ASCIM|nr:V-type ATPase [Ascobolus immersus RN42]
MAQSGVQNSAAIQRLLKAEKHGQQIVEEARKYRADRVKAAREEAKKETDLYEQDKKKELEQKKAELEKEKAQLSASAQDDVNKQKAVVDEAVTENGDKVVELLLSYVTKISPQAHRNVKTAANDKALKEDAAGAAE